VTGNWYRFFYWCSFYDLQFGSSYLFEKRDVQVFDGNLNGVLLAFFGKKRITCFSFRRFYRLNLFLIKSMFSFGGGWSQRKKVSWMI
jgi:hypothetical protein